MIASLFVSRLRTAINTVISTKVITTSYLDNRIALPESKLSEQSLGLMRTFEISDRLSVNGLKQYRFRTERPLGRLC